MMALIALIASRTGLTPLVVKAIAIVVLVCAVAVAVAIYNDNLRDQGAKELSNTLKANDQKTIEQKAKNDEELRKMDSDKLCNELSDSVCE